MRLFLVRRPELRLQGLGMWKEISSAPFDRDLELAVLASGEAHRLVFPCRRGLGGWLNAETGKLVDVRPTHWQEWTITRYPGELSSDG